MREYEAMFEYKNGTVLYSFTFISSFIFFLFFKQYITPNFKFTHSYNNNNDNNNNNISFICMTIII